MKLDVKKLSLFMAQKQMTIGALCARAGVSRYTIGMIKNHGREPNTATLGKIAAALEVSPAELVEKAE